MILLDPDLDPDPTPGASPGAKLPSVRTLARFLTTALAAVDLRGQVSVLLTTDAAIKDLNWRFRHKNRATDVLSFPAETMGPEKIAGDLAISVDTARGQADACGHSLAIELKILMLHGLLHLAGYDHEKDAGKMARRERLLRGRLRLRQGLIERSGATHASGSGKIPGSPTLAIGKNRKDGARSIHGLSNGKPTVSNRKRIAVKGAMGAKP